MKIQYFGDVNDYRKYALLRLLAKEGGFKIGVCWMLTDRDERSDGSNRRYLQQPEAWQGFDPELFEVLKTVPNPPSEADLQRVERQGLIPEAIYFEDLTPDAMTERNKFHHDCSAGLARANLVFFDPDNGLEVPSRWKGRKGSSKYVYQDEIAAHSAAGRSALIYQHYPRKEREAFTAETAERLGTLLAGASVWSFVTPHVVFFLAAQPAHAARVHAVTHAVEQRWTPKFFRAVRRHE